MMTGVKEETLFRLLEMTKQLISSQGYDKKLRIIVEKAAEIANCSRTCFVIINKKEEFVVKAGFPYGAHGIGEKVIPEYGENFLTEVIKGAFPVLIVNPHIDPRTAYMKELVKTYGISAVMYYPLFNKGEPLGILIFDAVGEEKFTKEISKNIEMLAELATRVLAAEYERRKIEEKLLKSQKLCELGEHSARIAHTIRNSLSVLIGAYARRIENVAQKSLSRGESINSTKWLTRIREYSNIIVSEVEKLEYIMDNVLALTRPISLCAAHGNIHEFLRNMASRLTFKGSVGLDLDDRLERVRVCFDERLLSFVVEDIVRNATEASATQILIKTKLRPKSRSLSIIIGNNGEKIPSNILPHIFEPFMTTKADGTGIGLTNVRAIIEAHGGYIKVHCEKETTFEISLPLSPAFV
jgi:signal transduction histidine kinase